MGVPAFYRWLSLKYPKTVVNVKEEEVADVDGVKIPVDTSKPNPNGEEYDNLYLDMNGIIHPASHPEEGPQPETEDDMYLAIFDYLERVFACVRPRKLLFMAIDGVAPRAKMNQQRSRRFKAAQEMQEKEQEMEKLREEWIKAGRELPKAKPESFDSNVITPGTPFMERLAIFLRWFVHKKISTDPGWRNIKVILSDASVPGEGEHKIMDFIRVQRAQAAFDPNTKHVIHGLDADLIMLALATHEPHFTILREEVTFGNKQVKCSMCGQMGHASDDCKGEAKEKSGEFDEQAAAVKRKPFQFLRISVLREYLEKELRSGDYACVGGFNLERVIDDFVFMCFFVGNDFLPHLPTLDIREGAIDTLIDLYMNCFNEIGGHLTDGGSVNLGRVECIMRKLALVEDEVLRKRRAQEERQKQKSVDIANKTNTQEHLELIRRLTANLGEDIVAVGKRPAGGEAVFSKRSRYENDTGSWGSEVTAEAFRIKNRGVGGLRVLPMGADEYAARRLHLMDKIRGFADCEDPKRTQLTIDGLNNADRAMVHGYCEELGLTHESYGEEPNRYIVVGRMPSSDDEDAEDGKEDSDAFEKEVKAMLRAKSDKKVEATPDEIKLGTDGWKERYYQTKFGPTLDRRALAKSYIEGLCWVMKYYYEGCQSWNWFFPFHYAPFCSDLLDIRDLKIGFSHGRPFFPFEQLMAVFPAASAHALPVAYRVLMSDPSSPIVDFYPTKFEQDLNGKRFMHQAVVLLPFIDETRLIAAIRTVEHTLEPDERHRNSFGETRLFVGGANPLSRQIAALPKVSKHAAIEGGEAASHADKKADTVALLSESELNDLAAEVVRAELSGDTEAQAEAEMRLKAAHAAKEGKRSPEEEGRVPLDTDLSGGVCGFVRALPDAPGLAETYAAPVFFGRREDHPYIPHNLPGAENNVAECSFVLPHAGLHVPRLRSNVTLPTRLLTELDVPQMQRFQSARQRPNDNRFKGKTCDDFMRGRCSRGDSCKYSHTTPNMQPNMQLNMAAANRMIANVTNSYNNGNGSGPASAYGRPPYTPGGAPTAAPYGNPYPDQYGGSAYGRPPYRPAPSPTSAYSDGYAPRPAPAPYQPPQAAYAPPQSAYGRPAYQPPPQQQSAYGYGGPPPQSGGGSRYEIGRPSQPPQYSMTPPPAAAAAAAAAPYRAPMGYAPAASAYPPDPYYNQQQPRVSAYGGVGGGVGGGGRPMYQPQQQQPVYQQQQQPMYQQQQPPRQQQPMPYQQQGPPRGPSGLSRSAIPGMTEEQLSAFRK
eukprot:m.106094 g.106094  ORF g.106094 m.106094 type:complete len:1271 (-) comp15807_c0_seq2:863-4675(-)